MSRPSPAEHEALCGLTRAHLDANVVATLSNGSRTRADILLVEYAGRRLVVKDYAARDWAYRTLLGRWHVRREVAAYRDLQGVPGIPAFCHQIDAYALAVPYVEGKSCAQCGPGELPDGFYVKLRGIAEAFHERGIAHCDLKKNTNILLTPSGDPVILDLASVLRRDSWFWPLRRFKGWLFRHFANDDLRAAAKLKRQLDPDRLTTEEIRHLEQRAPAERVFRWLRRRLLPVVKRLTTRARPEQPPDR
jgi:hypothetical protein